MSRHTTKRRSPGPLGSVRRLPSGRYQAYYRYLGDTFTVLGTAASWATSSPVAVPRSAWSTMRHP